MFTVVKGGEYLFRPGIGALRWLAGSVLEGGGAARLRRPVRQREEERHHVHVALVGVAVRLTSRYSSWAEPSSTCRVARAENTARLLVILGSSRKIAMGNQLLGWRVRANVDRRRSSPLGSGTGPAPPARARAAAGDEGPHLWDPQEAVPMMRMVSKVSASAAACPARISQERRLRTS